MIRFWCDPDLSIFKAFYFIALIGNVRVLALGGGMHSLSVLVLHWLATTQKD